MMNFASFVILATAIAGAAGQVMVNTPTSVVACLPVQFTWTGGQGPFYLSLLPGGKASAAPLEDLGQQSGNAYVWKADQPAGTSITLQIRDSQGQLNYSDQFTVQPGTTTCATGSSATSTSSSAPATTTGTAAANTSASKTPTTSTTTTSTTNSTGSTPKTTTGATTTGSTTGASTTGTTTGTSTNGTSASTDARSDASRASAGVLAVAVACVVAVFA